MFCGKHKVCPRVRPELRGAGDERAGGPVVRGTDDMISTRRAARARAIASAQLEYRAWSEDPQTAPIPAIAVLSSRAIHRREHDRALRRAQNGVFSTPARMAVAF